jgi:hyperosmotically inducible protein
MKTFENPKSLFRSTLVAAALASGLSATGPLRADTDNAAEVQSQSDSVGAAIRDTVITAEVKARFLREQRLKSANISVTTSNGVVTLAGTVRNADSRSVAVELAKDVQGVKSVDGQELSVTWAAVTASPAGHKLAKSSKRAISDSVITAKVKSELLADSVSKGFEVSVTTKRGVVMLSGNLANPDAIDHVKEIAGRVAGVKSVDASGLISRGG